LSGTSISDLEKQYDGKGYGDFKKDLAEVVGEFLTSFQERFNKISDDEALEVLAGGAKEIKPIAEDTIKKVKQSLGIKK
jgi:tryptophanyl-tRNA synthetase